jgi:hypothetical protein
MLRARGLSTTLCSVTARCGLRAASTDASNLRATRDRTSTKATRASRAGRVNRHVCSCCTDTMPFEPVLSPMKAGTALARQPAQGAAYTRCSWCTTARDDLLLRDCGRRRRARGQAATFHSARRRSNLRRASSSGVCVSRCGADGGTDLPRNRDRRRLGCLRASGSPRASDRRMVREHAHLLGSDGAERSGSADVSHLPTVRPPNCATMSPSGVQAGAIDRLSSDSVIELHPPCWYSRLRTPTHA